MCEPAAVAAPFAINMNVHIDNSDIFLISLVSPGLFIFLVYYIIFLRVLKIKSKKVISRFLVENVRFFY